MEFAYDGGGLAKGGTATLFVDGQQVGQGRVEATVPMLFSVDETVAPGSDTGSPVADDYPADPHFSGTIVWVQLEDRARRPGPPHHRRGAPPGGHEPPMTVNRPMTESCKTLHSAL